MKYDTFVYRGPERMKYIQYQNRDALEALYEQLRELHDGEPKDGLSQSEFDFTLYAFEVFGRIVSYTDGHIIDGTKVEPSLIVKTLQDVLCKTRFDRLFHFIVEHGGQPNVYGGGYLIDAGEALYMAAQSGGMI